MSFIDKIMNAMHLNTDDDEYDEDGLDFAYEEDEAEEDTQKKSFRKKEFKDVPREKSTVKTTPNITAFSKSSRKQGPGMEVCVVRPSSVEDAREITETLLNGRTVLLNMEGLNLEIAQRIIDFASGSCFAISGNLQKVSNYIFIITPSNVDVSGDFQEMFDSFDVGSLNN